MLKGKKFLCSSWVERLAGLVKDNEEGPEGEEDGQEGQGQEGKEKEDSYDELTFTVGRVKVLPFLLDLTLTLTLT